MSKSHKPVIDAFLNRKKKKINNTETCGDNLYLWGNRIAWWDEDNALWISTCNWNTDTTKDRINMLPDVWLRSFKGQLLLYVGNPSTQEVSDWIPWDGKAINVSELIFEKHNK